MKNAKAILLTASSLLAATPGFIILKTSLGVATADLTSLFFGVVEAAGCLFILVIYVNKEKIVLRTKDMKSKHSLILFFIFLAGLTCYILLLDICVVDTPFARGFLPLIWTNELSEEIASAGGKVEFVEKWMTDESRNIVQKTVSLNLTITVVIFLFIYVLTLVSLISSFTVITLNIKEESQD